MKALITGASSGIGRDMARYMSDLGIDLILVARNEERLKAVKEELKTNVEIISLDLSNAENCLDLHNRAKDIDILINNAGFGTFGEFDKTSLIEELNMICTNICATHTLTKLFLEDMIKRDSGYILNVSSIAGFMPGPLMATYYSTKAYILRLSQSIQEELKKKKSNVSISILCPGPTDTKFLEKAGVKFKMPYTTSWYVAQYGIDKMFKRKLIIVPGFKIKIANWGSRILPSRLMAKITYRMQRSRGD